jgi:copper(I)-binding protein
MDLLVEVLLVAGRLVVVVGVVHQEGFPADDEQVAAVRAREDVPVQHQIGAPVRAVSIGAASSRSARPRDVACRYDPPRRTAMLLETVMNAASLVLLGGCSGSPASPSAGITVTDAWARAASATAAAGAAYATITNGGRAADALVGASSPAAASVEIHETMEMGSPGASGGEMMGMQPVARVEIPAGGSIQLMPGGYHLMLIGLVKDLSVGDTIDLTLKFENAGEIIVKAQVRAS